MPEEMQTGCVCVIVVPTMGFYISPGKSFQKELSDLAVFPQVSRQPYQGDREGRQTQWNTPPGGAAPRLPNSTAPFSIISNRPDGKHYALGSTAFCSEGKRFLSPRQKLLWGFQIDTRITERRSRKRGGLRNDLTPFADFTDEQRDGKGSAYEHTASWW